MIHYFWRAGDDVDRASSSSSLLLLLSSSFSVRLRARWRVELGTLWAIQAEYGRPPDGAAFAGSRLFDKATAVERGSERERCCGLLRRDHGASSQKRPLSITQSEPLLDQKRDDDAPDDGGGDGDGAAGGDGGDSGDDAAPRGRAASSWRKRPEAAPRRRAGNNATASHQRPRPRRRRGTTAVTPVRRCGGRLKMHAPSRRVRSSQSSTLLSTQPQPPQ